MNVGEELSKIYEKYKDKLDVRVPCYEFDPSVLTSVMGNIPSNINPIDVFFDACNKLLPGNRMSMDEWIAYSDKKYGTI